MMLSTLLATLLAAAPGSDYLRFPPGVSTTGLVELTKEGEVWFLPGFDRLPFRAILATRAAGPCSAMEAGMMDVEGYKDRWPMKKIVILERTPTKVRYELTLDLVMAPTVPGEVERLGPGKVRYTDPDTGASSIWTMRDTAAGCSMTFSIADVKGKQSSYVSVARALESSSGDTMNMSGAIASVRGYTKAEVAKGGPSSIGPDGLAAWRALADEGTAIRFDRDPKRFARVHVSRRISIPPDRVLWAIRDRKHYTEKTEVIDKADERGGEAKYRIGFFGGRVSLQTKVVESGAVDGPEGLRITERVTGGDIDEGSWTWVVKAIDGGTEVDLHFDMNVIPGSSILSALAREDPGFKEGMALHLAVQLVGKVVGGQNLGRRAQVPLATAPAPTEADGTTTPVAAPP